MPDPSAIPAVTPSQMAAVDKAAAALGLDVLQLMELAGRAVAAAARGMLPGGDPTGQRVLVLAGPGGNGGDGLVAARLLHAWGARPEVRLSRRGDEVGGAAGHQLAILRNLPVPVHDPPADEDGSALPEADLLIDALLGFGLSGPPAGEAARLIRAANAHPAPMLAVDLPSGLDGATGEPYAPCIAADRTLTLALPKTGLLRPAARPVAGSLAVADIGLPPEAFAPIGLDIGPIFGRGEVVEILP